MLQGHMCEFLRDEKLPNELQTYLLTPPEKKYVVFEDL